MTLMLYALSSPDRLPDVSDELALDLMEQLPQGVPQECDVYTYCGAHAVDLLREFLLGESVEANVHSETGRPLDRSAVLSQIDQAEAWLREHPHHWLVVAVAEEDPTEEDS